MKSIEQEKENRDYLIKKYYTKSKKVDGKDGDDNIDNEEDDRPKNISPQVHNDLITKREERENVENAIESFEKSINEHKKTKENRIKTKYNLDRKKEELRNKINKQERKKNKFLNLIEISFPIKIDQFCKFSKKPSDGNKDPKQNELNNLKLSLDINDAVLISRNKLCDIDNYMAKLKNEKEVYSKNEKVIAASRLELEKRKKIAVVEEKACSDNFIKEQNLKFGTEINFDNLLKASRDTRVEELDNEYKILKKEADDQVESKKRVEEQLKMEYQQEININTRCLNDIKKLLSDNKQYDKSLEEKNNEINKKKEKKYELFNVEEKKEKLKEILKLLKQQMEALKKENEIFRKKGGHIYSTITSNLN